MRETLKIGESFEGLVPSKQRQLDGTYDYVLDPDGGVTSVFQCSTVINIIKRPKDEANAAQLVKDLLAKTSNNQNVVDGKLYRVDNLKIGCLFDPDYFYIVES